MSKQRGGEHQGGQHARQDKASGAWRGLAAGNCQAAGPAAIKAKITAAVQFILTWMLALARPRAGRGRLLTPAQPVT